ncbi:MAG TPA: kelch repeat-containing protein [Candidatus Eisenbacteria bacterium]|nr:kelch repeat-containing protein [Candidatus Eisenbacteria bacterium]
MTHLRRVASFRTLGLLHAALLLALASGASAQIGVWRESQLPARQGHCGVFDPTGRRLVTFGGMEATTLRAGVWELSLPDLGPSRWRPVAALGLPPSPRAGHTGIYDPVRHRMVVFGGNDGARSNEVLALSLTAPETWSLLTPSGSPPTARELHAAIYDPVGDRMIVFGGTDGTKLNDVWALSLADPPVWTLLTPAGTPPTPRSGASAVYDSQRQRMVVFGGKPDSGDGNETFALDLAGPPAWSQIVTSGTGPGQLTRHAALYDAPRDRMLIVSGESFFGDQVRLDSYQLNLAGSPTWQSFTIMMGSRSTLIYDAPKDRAILYGGCVDTPPATTSQAWIVPLTGTAPATRLVPSFGPRTGWIDETAVFDPVRRRTLVFGGVFVDFLEPIFSSFTSTFIIPLWQGPNPPPDLVYDWINFGNSGALPSPRYAHSAVVDAPGDRMIVFAGHSESSLQPVNDVWSLELGTGTWSALEPTGDPPAARLEHSAIFDSPARRMIVFGGQTVALLPPLNPLNDLWQLDLDVSPPAWSPITPEGTPPPARSCHSAIFDVAQRRMVVFGGRDASDALLNDVWSLDLNGTPTWTELTPSGTPPSPRDQHAAIYMGGTSPRMLVYGGNATREVWSLSLNGSPAWTLESVGVPPDVSDTPLAVVPGADGVPFDDGPTMLILGGKSASVWELRSPTSVAVGASPSSGLRLRGVRPNPTAGLLSVAFTLEDGAKATLDLFDLSGRRVATRNVGVLGAGAHVVSIAEATSLAPGLYWVRLTRLGQSESARVAVVR